MGVTAFALLLSRLEAAETGFLALNGGFKAALFIKFQIFFISTANPPANPHLLNGFNAIERLTPYFWCRYLAIFDKNRCWGAVTWLTEAQNSAITRRLGHKSRVAFLSFPNFGNPMKEGAARMRAAVKILDQRKVEFEYDGEMAVDVALNKNLMRELYPHCRLSHAANILITPGLHAANISYKLLRELGGGKVIGPLIWGLQSSVHRCGSIRHT